MTSKLTPTRAIKLFTFVRPFALYNNKSLLNLRNARVPGKKSDSIFHFVLSTFILSDDDHSVIRNVPNKREN